MPAQRSGYRSESSAASAGAFKLLAVARLLVFLGTDPPERKTQTGNARFAELPSPDEALWRSVCGIHKDDVLRVASRRIDGKKDDWPLKNGGESMNDTALEEQ